MRLFMIFLLAASLNPAVAKDSIQFNTQGEVIPPDEVHLARGLEHEQDGFADAAINSFTKASAYGNEHARFFIGLLHLQENRYIDALAWLYLVNAEKINRVDKIQQLKAAAMAELTDAELLLAEEVLLRLERTHNATSARLKRASWRNNLKFTGSNVRGRITPGVRVYANARLEVRPDGTLDYLQATPISSNRLRSDLEEFVFQYRYDLAEGTVEMHDIETED